MIKALRHLTGRDKRALAVFFGIALLCALYFSSGILVTYVSSPSDAMEMAREGTGYTVRVLGLQTFAAAEQLSNAIREQRRIQTVIEAVPGNQGYLIKIGPLVRREAAETLTSELYSSGYSIVKIVENCPQGANCNPPQSNSASPGNTERK
jgi:hypothetical protein